jgi:hypothetical protein
VEQVNKANEYLFPTELTASARSSLLETINLSLFLLINEDIDQSLKLTGS